MAYQGIFCLQFDSVSCLCVPLCKRCKAHPYTSNYIFLGGAEVDRVKFRKAGKGSMSDKEMSALNDKHLNRIIEYLRSIGWTEEKILAFIQYVTE